ncbi:MAG: M14 family zinc carboxypeptidase [Thermoanaerobaculum sp.]
MKAWLAFCFALVAGAAGAGSLATLPPAEFDPAVPTAKHVLGYDWGEEISDPAQIQAYAEALARAVPDRVKLVPYATSFEGRRLFLLVVGKTQNLADLETTAARVRKACDPRIGSGAAGDLPLVVWLVGSVHGDEASGGEAALALAYYLAAARSPEVHTLFERVIVVLDPMQNPDGRARFVAATRQARGLRPDDNPASAEHVQPWPGGRFSHYLFDLNRDWFALTHPETQGRVAKMLWLPPQVVVDLHEMGSEQGYFFPPPAEPHNPFVSREQGKLWELLGRNLGRAFDDAGVRFWTRETFDAFYPGYGESWPFFSGACGATYEQASSRGLAVRLRTGEVLRYEDTVAHHLLGAYVTVKTAAENARSFWESFLSYRQKAVDEGKGLAYVWDASREGAGELARLLARQGLEVFRAEGGPRAGSYVLPLAQPLGRLARVLLSREVPLPTDFIERQERREKKRLPDEIYDVTAWSLPLLWNIRVEETKVPPVEGLQPVRPDETPSWGIEGEGKVAFLLPWEGLASARAASRLLDLGVKAGVAEGPFSLAGTRYPAGTLVIRRRENPDDLRQKLEAVAKETGVRFFGAESSIADAGFDLGSNRVRPLAKPRVALVWDAPASPLAAGHLRFALEQQLGLHVTPVRGSTLLGSDLSQFSVILIPDSFSGAAYSRLWQGEELERLKNWVREGGLLVAEGSAAAFLTGEKVGLLASSLEKRGGGAKGAAKESKGEAEGAGAPPDYETLIRPSDEEPPQVPGAILAVKLDTEHLLSAGFPSGKVYAIVNSRRVFAPLKLDKGVNVGIYGNSEELVVSGFVFEESKKLLPNKAYLMVQRHGRGMVVAFAEPPAFRGLTRATTLLLANAVLFGPALLP